MKETYTSTLCSGTRERLEVIQTGQKSIPNKVGKKEQGKRTYSSGGFSDRHPLSHQSHDHVWKSVQDPLVYPKL